MPNIHMPLPETEQNIFRPIVMEVVKQVQDLTKMKDAQVYFPDGDKMHHHSGTVDSTGDRLISTTSKRMNYIEVEEEIDQEEISPTFFDSKENASIFEDRKTGLVITPVYAKHNVVIAFNYQCGGKTEATRWLQDMRMKLARLRDINEHSVTYHFNLNVEAYNIIKKVHELREQREPYGQTLDQYVLSHISPKMTIVGDMAGKSSVFAFAQTQREIYGQFEFDALPSKPEKDPDTGMWVIAFGYKFNYDKPIGCHVRYPIIVHNNLMPYEWVSFTDQEVRGVGQTVSDGSRTQNAMRLFRADRVMDRIKSEDGMLLIPQFDDFVAVQPLQRTAGIIQALAVVGDTNKRDIVDLNDLGDVAIDSEVLAFLRTEYQWLLKPYQSLFNISVYQNDLIQHYDRFEMGSDLVVKAKYDLNVRNQYRMRLSVVTDLDFISKEAMQRIRAYPQVMVKIVKAINRAFRENPEMNKLGPTKLLNPCMFDYVYRHLLGKEGGVTFGEISFAASQHLRSCAIDEKFIRRLKTESKFQARTMILGILAMRKDDPRLKGNKLPDMSEAGTGTT